MSENFKMAENVLLKLLLLFFQSLGLELPVEEHIVSFKDHFKTWKDCKASVCAVYVPTQEIVGALLTQILTRSDPETFGKEENFSEYSSKVSYDESYGINAIFVVSNRCHNSCILWKRGKCTVVSLTVVNNVQPWHNEQDEEICAASFEMFHLKIFILHSEFIP